MGKWGFLLIAILFATSFVALVVYLNKCFKRLKNKKINNFLKNITLDNINSLTGNEFEVFLYYLFLNMGFDVILTPKSHDYGADLILKIHNKTIVVQSKLYNNHNIGISSIQEVYASIKYYKADLGIVVTNSKFTKNSINLANSTNVLLWDKDMLMNLLSFKESEKQIFKNQLFYTIINEQ